VSGQCSVKWFDVLSVPTRTDCCADVKASGKGLLVELQGDIYSVDF